MDTHAESPCPPNGPDATPEPTPPTSRSPSTTTTPLPSPPSNSSPPQQTIPLHNIHPPRDNAGRASIDPDRVTSLANSISRCGLINPITLRAHPTIPDHYEIAAGVHRHAAALFLGWTQIPARVMLTNDHNTALIRLAENVTRSNLSPVEEAQALAPLLEQPDTGTDEIAHAIGRTRTWVESRLEILAYPADLIAHLHTRKISMAAAERLAQIPDPERRATCIREAAAHGISARVAALWLQDALANAGTEETLPEKARFQPISEFQTVTLTNCFACRQKVELTRTHSVRICDHCIAELHQTPPPAEQPQQPATPPNHAPDQTSQYQQPY